MYKALLFFLASLLLFVACKETNPSPSEGGFYIKGIYFGQNLSYPSKSGIRDGCTTAQGDYQKDHTRFKYSKAYQDAWFIGRNACKPLLIVPVEANSTHPDENTSR